MFPEPLSPPHTPWLRSGHGRAKSQSASPYLIPMPFTYVREAISNTVGMPSSLPILTMYTYVMYNGGERHGVYTFRCVVRNIAPARSFK